MCEEDLEDETENIPTQIMKHCNVYTYIFIMKRKIEAPITHLNTNLEYINIIEDNTCIDELFWDVFITMI